MQALVRWLRENDFVLTPPGFSIASSLAKFTEQHDVGRMPEASSEYWTMLHRLVALGRIDQAQRLLGLHSAWERVFSHDDKSIAVQVMLLIPTHGGKITQKEGLSLLAELLAMS